MFVNESEAVLVARLLFVKMEMVLLLSSLLWGHWLRESISFVIYIFFV